MLVALAGIAALSLTRGGLAGLPIAAGAGAGGAAPVPLPDGMVIAVAADACPYPWRDYRPAQGRFVIGAGSGAALNLDANGVLLGGHEAGETGGQAGVELLLADVPPHTHRLAVAEAWPGTEGLVRDGLGAEAGATLGILAPFAIKPPTRVRRHDLVAPLESVGGVITSHRRSAARRHATIPPFVALTYCVYTRAQPLEAVTTLGFRRP